MQLKQLINVSANKILSILVSSLVLCSVNPIYEFLIYEIHEFLSWDAHVKELCKKLAQTNGILSTLRYFVPQTTCISVYFSLFSSFVLYGSSAWQFTSKTNLNSLHFAKEMFTYNYVFFLQRSQ